MSKKNILATWLGKTHEGARAVKISPEQELRRTVMACFLWEDTFYETGEAVADRIKDLVGKVPAAKVIEMAIEARTKHQLRHVPLWLLVALIQKKSPSEAERGLIGRAIPEVIGRPDELGEFLALYWKDGKLPLTRQMKIGLANAFKKFNEYSLAKYDSDKAAIKLRDVMFLCHPRPDNDDQKALFQRVAERTLKTPDTWEVALSGGANKKETFERLMAERKLGVLAFIRNFRNMSRAGVEKDTVRGYASTLKVEKALPFRFIAAARAVPAWSDIAEEMMLRCLNRHDTLMGKTVIVVDNSGSMHGTRISRRSDLDRADAAGAVAVLIREVCEDCAVIGYGTLAEVVPAHFHGLSLIDAIRRGPGGGTDTGKALELANSLGYDRIIVITDE